MNGVEKILLRDMDYSESLINIQLLVLVPMIGYYYYQRYIFVDHTYFYFMTPICFNKPLKQAEFYDLEGLIMLF